MTDDYTRAFPTEPGSGEPARDPSTSGPLSPALGVEAPVDESEDGSASAKDKVKGVAGSAGDAAGSVLDEARSGAGDVKQEAQRQARDLWDQAQGELSDQTAAQQSRLAAGLRAFGGQLDQMASAPDEPGAASHLARDLGTRADSAGRWLEDHSPQEALDELRSFARRRPGTFLLAAAGAGLLVGRLTRALKDGPSDSRRGSAREDDARTGTRVAEPVAGDGTSTSTADTAAIPTAVTPESTPAPGVAIGSEL